VDRVATFIAANAVICSVRVYSPAVEYPAKSSRTSSIAHHHPEIRKQQYESMPDRMSFNDMTGVMARTQSRPGNGMSWCRMESACDHAIN
jgi:hypothetical protein